MAIEGATKADVRKALDLAPLDMLVCEYCGHETYAPPGVGGEVKCFRCNRTMDKSHFSLVARKQKLWVSEKGVKLRLKQQRMDSCSCVTYYRDAVRFRRAIFHMYDSSDGQITSAQALAVFVAFWAGSGEGVLKLLGRRDRAMELSLPKGAYRSEDELHAGSLWDALASVPIKEGVGRPTLTDTLILSMDAVVLNFCQNAYVHFLRDALRLRANEYKMRTNQADEHQQMWNRFWKAKRAVETSCKRKWQALWNEIPEPPPEDWWERVARQQGLIGYPSSPTRC